jgi:PAS domain S-box-containing protein
MEIELSRLIDALPGLVWTTTPDGTSQLLNQRWREYAGLTPDDVQVHGWKTAIHPDDLPVAQAHWDAAFAARAPTEVEARLRRFNGEYRRFSIKTCPVNGADGRLAGWCGINTEIEDRKRAEEAVLAHERRFQFVVDGLPAIAALFAPTGKIIFCNRQMLEYLGETLEGVQAKPSAYNYHPDDRHEVLTEWTASVRSGAPFDREARLCRADGVYRWHRTRVFPLRNAAGEIDVWYGLSTDIEDTKHGEATLAAEKRLLELVARGVALPEVLDGVCRELEGLAPGSYASMLLVDPVAGRFRLGAAPGLPEPCRRILDGAAIDPAHDPCALAVGLKVPIIIADVADDPRWAASPWPSRMTAHGLTSCWSTPILSSSQDVLGVFAVYRKRPASRSADEQELIERFTKIAGIAIERVQADASLKAHEAALSRARADLEHVARVTALGALTASIAHEVNQPLAGIITNASTCLRMLAAEPPNLDGARATAQRTIRDGNRASDVIQRLRALFARRGPEIEPVDLNETAREVLALSSSDLQRRQVTAHTDFDDGLPWVRGDRVQLQQVILNLVLNAADAMGGAEDGPRDLWLTTTRDEADRIVLSVRDSGVGIEPEELEQLFNAFYTTKPQGMGIGLSISRSIIQAHEGRLWASANDGPGATFSFSIPCPPEATARSVQAKPVLKEA